MLVALCVCTKQQDDGKVTYILLVEAHCPLFRVVGNAQVNCRVASLLQAAFSGENQAPSTDS